MQQLQQQQQCHLRQQTIAAATIVMLLGFVGLLHQTVSLEYGLFILKRCIIAPYFLFFYIYRFCCCCCCCPVTHHKSFCCCSLNVCMTRHGFLFLKLKTVVEGDTTG